MVNRVKRTGNFSALHWCGGHFGQQYFARRGHPPEAAWTVAVTVYHVEFFCVIYLDSVTIPGGV